MPTKRNIQAKAMTVTLSLLAVIMGLQGCTTKRDGRAYRIYHNTHARFNGYYYATEALKEADVKINELHEPNWDEVLPVFIETEEESAQQVYPLMERAIEKCSKVVDKHTLKPSRRNKKNFRRPEFNKWIDENYTVIGTAYYLKQDYPKSEEIFRYLSRTVDTDDAQAWAYSWLGRVYLKTGNTVKSKNMLAKAEQYRFAAPEIGVHTNFVWTQYHINEGNFEEAARYLEKAIELIDKKKDKARPKFILAQLLREMGDSEKAIETFEEVADMRIPYELEFQANIQQAMTYDRKGGSSQAIVEMLEKMLDDDKNREYLDQIYYALADVALEDRRRDDGMDLLETSIYVSEGNSRQLGKSYLRLADLYMEDLSYEVAQAYYDSALVHMPEDNVRKDEVSNLASNLTDLVQNLRIIEEKDSLLELCSLEEVQRIRVVERIWDDMAEDLERQKEEQEAANQAAIEAAGSVGEGMFWPYNGALRVSGYQNFVDYWGDRELEDHWRRSVKMSQLFSDEEGTEEGGEEEESVDMFDPESLPTIEEMLAALPCEGEENDAAYASLAEAYYNAGLDYREKLNDAENAIETWLELLERMDSSAFHPTATYQMFRTYLQRETEEEYSNPFCETCNSEYWAGQIVQNFPGSEWAMLIENPDYLDAEEQAYQEERAIYEAFLSRFYAKDYQNTLLEINVVIEERPTNPLICKYHMLAAQCVGGLTSYSRDRTPYYDALRGITTTCPDTEESAFADDLLRKLGQKAQTPSSEPDEEQPTSAFEVNPEKSHYFAVIVPVSSRKANAVKAKSTDFNKEYFNSQRLRVTSNLINRENEIVLIKSFSNQKAAIDYHTVYTGNREILINVNSGGFDMFVISSTNYIELFKNKDIEGYLDFFNDNYLSEKSNKP